MGLFKREKVWWMRFSYNGKQVRRSCETTSKKLAEQILCKVKTQITEGKFLEVEARDTTFEELYLDLILDYKVNRRKSLDKIHRTIRHLEQTFSGMRALDITTSLIQGHIVERQTAGAANASINREMAALKRMFRLGVRTTPPKVTSIPYIPHLQENNVRQGYFEHDEYIAMKDALLPHMKPVIVMAYFTGMRKMEIFGLLWSQVSLAEGKITLTPQDTKNKKARVIYMEGELLKAIRSQKALRDEKHPGAAYVFFGISGEPIKDFRSAWNSACKKAGLEGKIFHDFRRTAVRNMVRAGVPEQVAMNISGHKTRSVFERYNIVNEDDLKLAAQKVQKRFSTILAQSAKSDLQATDITEIDEAVIH